MLELQGPEMGDHVRDTCAASVSWLGEAPTFTKVERNLKEEKKELEFKARWRPDVGTRIVLCEGFGMC